MKKKMDAPEIIRDIKKGLGDVPIMEKYELSPAEYMRILEKLRDLKAVEGHEVARRLTSGDRTTIGFEARRTRRCYLFFPVTACDVSRPEITGQVQDLAEKGFQVADMAARSGEIIEFTVRSDAPDHYLQPFSLAAKCRWSRRDPSTGMPVSGFEIVKISRSDMEELQKLIEFMTICDVQ